MKRKNIFDMDGVLIGFIMSDKDTGTSVYLKEDEEIQHQILPPKVFANTSTLYARPEEARYLQSAKDNAWNKKQDRGAFANIKNKPHPKQINGRPVMRPGENRSWADISMQHINRLLRKQAKQKAHETIYGMKAIIDYPLNIDVLQDELLVKKREAQARGYKKDFDKTVDSDYAAIEVRTLNNIFIPDNDLAWKHYQELMQEYLKQVFSTTPNFNIDIGGGKTKIDSKRYMKDRIEPTVKKEPEKKKLRLLPSDDVEQTPSLKPIFPDMLLLGDAKPIKEEKPKPNIMDITRRFCK